MRRFLVTCVLVLACALIVQAAPTTKPSGPKLFAPYSKMNSLTDEQKEKIHEIRRKYLADMHDLELKQTEQITALLNDDQKKELREIEEKAAADAKTKSGAKKDATPNEEK
jgi:hypothetical protein